MSGANPKRDPIHRRVRAGGQLFDFVGSIPSGTPVRRIHRRPGERVRAARAIYRARGKLYCYGVAPHAGARIETPPRRSLSAEPDCRPSRGAWIEARYPG